MAGAYGIGKKLLEHTAVLAIRHGTQKLFSKYLLLTNTTIAFTLAGTGDLFNQHYEKLRGMRTEWSPVRARNQCVQGLIFGPLYHFWYIALDRALPGYAARVVVKKVFIDQLLMAPISVTIYLTVLGLLEGQSTNGILDDVRTKGRSLLAIEWSLGPVTQLVNFFLLPTRFRVAYDSSICLAYDAYYSYVKYRKDYETTRTPQLDKPKADDVVIPDAVSTATSK